MRSERVGLAITAACLSAGAAIANDEPAPAAAATPESLPAGRLHWKSSSAAVFDVVHDPFGYAVNAELAARQLPAATVAWVVDGETVLPLDQAVQSLAHPNWDIAFQPGRAWRDADAGRRLNLSLPFALVEKNANCTHNGFLDTVLDDASAPRLTYRIASETCAYFKFDMAGVVDAQYEPEPRTEAGRETADAWRRHRDARLPVLPLAALPDDYPGFDLAAFAAMDRDDLTVYGFVIDGKHYRSDCRTRAGDYAFCDELLLPSYSTAKSIFAGLALMRLQAVAPGARNATIGELVDACQGKGWDDVRIEDALDMATGHYESIKADKDEASPEHLAFIYTRTHDERIRLACNLFPKKAAPGARFVYHSSDTYLAGTAMQAVLDREQPGNHGLYDALIVQPFWAALELGAAIRTSLVTPDDRAQPFGGWGLFYTPDDIVRIALWLGAGAPGLAEIDQELLRAALKQDPEDPGLPAGDGLHYNNGFWTWDAGPYLGCKEAVHVPFMSGYGGIAVVLFPNGTVYYYFGDGYQQRWRKVAFESHKLRGLC